MDICFTHHNIQRCESDNGYPENDKMVVQLLIDTVSVIFAGLASSASAVARKTRWYTYPEEECFLRQGYGFPSVFLRLGDDGA